MKIWQKYGARNVQRNAVLLVGTGEGMNSAPVCGIPALRFSCQNENAGLPLLFRAVPIFHQVIDEREIDGVFNFDFVYTLGVVRGMYDVFHSFFSNG